MTDPQEARLVELEGRLAHFEKLADDLSAVMADQGRLIDALNAQVRRLAERLGEVEAVTARTAPDDKPPPHY